jgi:hypothetical protein
MQEKSQHLHSTSSLFENKDNTFLEIFFPELSNLVISLLRENGFTVITFFDRFTDRRRILATMKKANTSKFISIDIKSGNQKNQRSYKNRVLRNGGAFLSVSSLQEFYQKFQLISGGARNGRMA